MRLHELLRPERIIVPLDAEKKCEAISELVDVLVQYHEVPMTHRHGIVDEFAQNQWGAGLERGIAVPHLSTDRVEDFIFALGISPQGINFSSLDDKPAKVVLLALTPKKALAQELEILGDITDFLAHGDLANRLAAAKSSAEAYEILSSATAAA